MTRIVIGNWKMNPATVGEAVGLATQVAAAGETSGVEVGIAPPAISLVSVAEATHGTHVSVYSQDVHWEEKGAYTGQISAEMLKGHAAGAIVGHSEVRRDLGDDDLRVAKKLARAIATGLRVVLCVGESEAQYLAGQTDSVIARQITAATAPLTAGRERASQLVIAYEPIWAIGTGRPATAAHASAAARAIRRALEAAALPPATPILYGGSVTATIAAEFAAADGIDGALVGGASLKAQEFADIVKAFA
ncbi:MAG TPA: triose-phosphate isomerase [Candidatus Limnocylindrales bacterium]|nr:triose-phosphate isomerase [Candidatus Limnocylindrales bacterium]